MFDPARRLLWAALLGLAGTLVPVAPASGQTALQFNGSTQYVRATQALAASQFTVELWFRRDGAGAGTGTGTGGLTGAVPLVAKGAAQAEDNVNDLNYFLGISSTNTLCADFENFAGAGSSPNHPLTAATGANSTIANGVWYHGALTYDGAAMRLYLNGSLVATATPNVTPAAATGSYVALATTVRSDNLLAAGFFNGAMDEVRIWNVALSQCQIMRIDEPRTHRRGRTDWALGTERRLRAGRGQFHRGRSQRQSPAGGDAAHLGGGVPVQRHDPDARRSHPAGGERAQSEPGAARLDRQRNRRVRLRRGALDRRRGRPVHPGGHARCECRGVRGLHRAAGDPVLVPRPGDRLHQFRILECGHRDDPGRTVQFPRVQPERQRRLCDLRGGAGARRQQLHDRDLVPAHGRGRDHEHRGGGQFATRPPERGPARLQGSG